MYTYTWYQWLTFFYLYCFFGWIFGSTYVSSTQQLSVAVAEPCAVCGAGGAGACLIV